MGVSRVVGSFRGRREGTPQSPPTPSSTVAFEAIYRANINLIYRFIYHRVGNREDAEDVTSEVFLKAVRWLDSDRSPQAIQAWLYATARTLVASHWGQRLPPGSMDIEDLRELLVVDDDTSQSDAQAQAHVRKILAGLSERDSAVLTLRLLRGYSVAETAAVLRVSEGNVKVLQHRALRRAATITMTQNEGETDGERS